jgi:outer membrane receptor protein involved in Fe transport
MRRRTRRIASVIAATSTLIATTAGAQQTPATSSAPTNSPSTNSSASKDSSQIETIVVTAQKRKEDASKVPLSISVIRGDDLTAQHIGDFEDITKAIPNVAFSGGGGGGNAGNGPGLSNIEMRGVSSQAGSATVGIYVDDVSMTASNLYSMGSIEPKFFDLDHVEVLRGPQGTLYGASSMGGTVKFVSNQPNLKDTEATGYSEVSQTEHGGTNYTINGVMNTPLIPGELALRIGVEGIHQSGYVNQVSPTTGAVVASGINYENDAVVRMALKWTPTLNLTLTPTLYYQQVNTGDISVAYDSLPLNETSKVIREPGTDQLIVPSLTANYAMDIGDLTSVSSFFQRKFNRTQDGTVENSPYLGSQISNPALNQVVSGLPSAIILGNQERQFSQEVRIASHPYDPSVSSFTWLAGAYVADQHTNIVENDPVFGVNAAFVAAGASPSDPSVLAGAVSAGFPNDDSYFSARHYHDKQQAIFGEANYYFMPNLHATAGLRYLQATDSLDRVGALYYNNDGTNDGNSASSSTTSGNKATPKFALTWEVDKTDTLYASAAEGFRLGGSNFQIPQAYCGLANPNPLSYQSDSLWSYEIGDKSRFFDNHLSVNAAVFYVDWKNLQQQIALSCGFNYNTNVGNANSSGAEIEIKAKPIPHLVIDFSGGITHAVLSDDAGQNAGIVGAVSGAPVPGVPHFNAALSAQYNYNFSSDLFGYVRGAAHWTGASYGGFPLLPNGSVDPDYHRPAYSTVDFSTGLSWDKWEVSLFAKNLFDNEKVIQHPVVQTQDNEVYRIAPRIIGISLSAKM